MNKIKLDLGSGYEPSLKISIDGIDLFTIKEFRNEYRELEEDKCEYRPTLLTNFLLNEWRYRKLLFLDNPKKMPKKNTVFNGIMLIGVCNLCDEEGCQDLPVIIETKGNTTTWELRGFKKYVFDVNEYKNEIQKITESYYSYSWENETHKINRIIIEFIKKNNLKNDNKYMNNTIEIYYSGEYLKELKIKWDDKIIEADYHLMNLINNLTIKKKLVKPYGTVVYRIDENALHL